VLTEKGIEEAEKIFKEFSERERDILEEVLDLFDGNTDDEILAVFILKFLDFQNCRVLYLK